MGVRQLTVALILTLYIFWFLVGAKNFLPNDVNTAIYFK